MYIKDQDLYSFFDEGKLFLKHQKQHCLTTQQTNTSEILLGVSHRSYKNRPDYFMNAIGREGRVKCTLLILEQVESLFQHSALEKVSVNMDALTLMHPLIIRRIMRVRRRIMPALCIEITEDQYIPLAQVEQLKRIMYYLRYHDTQFSMDDYGKGFSTSERFTLFPFDQIKFDKSFMEDNLVSVEQHIQSELPTLHQDIEIVFEGIEKQQEVERIHTLSLPHSKIILQGYYFDRPSQLA